LDLRETIHVILKTLKRILPIALIFTLLSFDYAIDEVVSAIKVGDAQKMSKYFDSMVDITLKDRSHSYSRSQAEMILRDFFTNSGVKNFKVVHRGNSNDSEYCVGSLATKNGEYRTTIFMRIRGDRKFLQEVRFESAGN
jgi:hypothetical protein